ncbi:MAG: hypothetical protein L3J47_02735 [Sulfurovum sp.]|nr:hypothetical protein [Sulfurovum sp.]
MKVIIDLIEDVRESIANAEDYQMTAGLLKEDPEDASKLHFAGEALVNRFVLDSERKKLHLIIDGSDTTLSIGELIPSLLIMDMDAMMYEVALDIQGKYKDVEVVGFGKNDEEKRYVLFIKP